jgi:carboxylesterase type B
MGTPDGTFTGLTNASTGIIYFRGVRFADPPLGDLRWRAPVSPPSTHLGHVNASQVLHPFHYRFNLLEVA